MKPSGNQKFDQEINRMVYELYKLTTERSCGSGGKNKTAVAISIAMPRE
jgi:hypothetical protein